MRINIKARPNSREELVERIDATNFVVSVKEPPVAGRANQAIVRVLADYFGKAQMQIKIVSGYTSRHKIIEIS